MVVTDVGEGTMSSREGTLRLAPSPDVTSDDPMLRLASAAGKLADSDIGDCANDPMRFSVIFNVSPSTAPRLALPVNIFISSVKPRTSVILVSHFLNINSSFEY